MVDGKLETYSVTSEAARRFPVTKIPKITPYKRGSKESVSVGVNQLIVGFDGGLNGRHINN